jgi:hypothetical protein
VSAAALVAGGNVGLLLLGFGLLQRLKLLYLSVGISQGESLSLIA